LTPKSKICCDKLQLETEEGFVVKNKHESPT